MMISTRPRRAFWIVSAASALAFAATGLATCADQPALSPVAGFGAAPQLPAPEKSLVPTVNIAPAKGWVRGAKPVAAPGFSVSQFADDLVHPRWLYFLPNGDVLVAETNAPPKDANSLRAMVMKQVMKRAGAAVPSPNRITLLRDADRYGVAETRSVFLDGLNSPFGMALVGGAPYVADTDALLRFPYADGDTRITAKATKLLDLPAGPINHHWTKNLVASRDAAKLYVSVGSDSNVGENGIENETGRAAIREIDVATGGTRIFASGLRNPVDMG